MTQLFANDRDGDPANPEKYPQRYIKVRCAQCSACYLDTLVGRCFAGGPFDAALGFSMADCRRF